MCILWSLWAGPTNEWPDVAPPVGKKKTTFCEKITIFFNLRQTQQKFGAVTFLSISCDFCFSPSSLFLLSLSFFLDRLLTKALLSQNDGRRWDRIHSIEKKVSKLLQKCFFSLPAKENWRWEKLVMFWYAELWAILRDLGSGTVAERLWAPAKLTLFVNSKRM